MNKYLLNKNIDAIFHKTGKNYLKMSNIVKVVYDGSYPKAIKDAIYMAFAYNLTDDPAMSVIKEAANQLESEGVLSFDVYLTNKLNHPICVSGYVNADKKKLEDLGCKLYENEKEMMTAVADMSGVGVNEITEPFISIKKIDDGFVVSYGMASAMFKIETTIEDYISEFRL